MPIARHLPVLASALLLAAPAWAQSSLGSGAMPPPPSASDPLPKSRPEKARSGRRSDASRSDPAAAAEARSSRATSSGYSDRIDTRPARRDMQLEDDPRAVQPVLQNGRPGVGMRF